MLIASGTSRRPPTMSYASPLSCPHAAKPPTTSAVWRADSCPSRPASVPHAPSSTPLTPGPSTSAACAARAAGEGYAGASIVGALLACVFGPSVGPGGCACRWGRPSRSQQAPRARTNAVTWGAGKAASGEDKDEDSSCSLSALRQEGGSVGYG